MSILNSSALRLLLLSFAGSGNNCRHGELANRSRLVDRRMEFAVSSTRSASTVSRSDSGSGVPGRDESTRRNRTSKLVSLLDISTRSKSEPMLMETEQSLEAADAEAEASGEEKLMSRQSEFLQML